MKEREQIYDIAKGLGILFVILGHIDVGGVANAWLYSFQLPIFFVITGICFHYSDDFGEYLRKKAKRCLIPYFTLGILIVAVETFTGYLYETGFEENLVRLLIQRRYSTLWFLATLFFASLIFYFIVKICKQNPIAVWLVTVIISLVFVTLDQTLISSWVWNIDTAFIILGYIGFGYFIKNYKSGLDLITKGGKAKRVILTVVFFILNVVLHIANLIRCGHGVDMYWNSYGVFPLMYGAAVFGTLMTITFSSLISSRSLSYLGRCSMVYFALHQSVFFYPYQLLLKALHIMPKSFSFQTVLAKILLLAMIIASCWLVDTLIRRTKLKWILGD